MHPRSKNWGKHTASILCKAFFFSFKKKILLHFVRKDYSEISSWWIFDRVRFARPCWLGRRQATVEKEQGKGGKGAFAESAVQSELWKRRRAP